MSTDTGLFILIFKFSVSNATGKYHVTIFQLESVINKIKDVEQQVSENEP